MKKHMVVEDREAANQAVKSGVLRQIASGFYYGDATPPTSLDTARADAALYWAKGLKGEPGIVFYEFVEQIGRASCRERV